LGGLCFFLSLLEYMVPKPLPFIRLGLANVPLLLALDILPFSSFLLLLGLKVIGQGLVSGTLFSYVFVFSLGGTGVSALLMYALRRFIGKEKISLIGISAAGALASNGVQLVLARLFIFGESVRYAAAPILALGIVTGTALGVCCELFIRRSRWYACFGDARGEGPFTPSGGRTALAEARRIPGTTAPADSDSPVPGKRLERARKARETFCLKTFRSGDLAVTGLCVIPALLLNPNTPARIVQFLLFFALAWLSGKKNNLLVTVSVMGGITFFNLLVPYGKVLFSLGPLSITSGALWGGVRRAVTLEGLFMLSRFSVRRDLALPGAFGEIIGESLRIFSLLGDDFSRLTGEKKPFDRKTLADRLDMLLVSVSEDQRGNEKKPGKRGYYVSDPSRPADFGYGPRIILAAAVILAWLPLIAVTA
jgi:heptaprenyl diphosphate synthase